MLFVSLTLMVLKAVRLKKKLRDEAIEKGFIQPKKQSAFKKFFEPLFSDNYIDHSLDDEIVVPKGKNDWDSDED